MNVVTLSSSPAVVQVADRGQGCDLFGALDDSGTQSPGVVHRDLEGRHQGAGVLPEPLLARHQRVAVVLVFNLTLGEIVGEANVVMRGQQQACALALQPFSDGADFVRCGFLFRHDVVQPEHHEGVGIGKDPLVDREFVAGLVDALEDGDRVAGGFASQVLESQRRAVEKFQGAGDSLEEVRLVVFRCLVARP